MSFRAVADIGIERTRTSVWSAKASSQRRDRVVQRVEFAVVGHVSRVEAADPRVWREPPLGLVHVRNEGSAPETAMQGPAHPRRRCDSVVPGPCLALR